MEGKSYAYILIFKTKWGLRQGVEYKVVLKKLGFYFPEIIYLIFKGTLSKNLRRSYEWACLCYIICSFHVLSAVCYSPSFVLHLIYSIWCRKSLSFPVRVCVNSAYFYGRRTCELRCSVVRLDSGLRCKVCIKQFWFFSSGLGRGITDKISLHLRLHSFVWLKRRRKKVLRSSPWFQIGIT